MTDLGRSSGQAALQQSYDAVVIGSGLGGSSLAYRLSQLGRRVLLVERGDFLKPDRRDPSEPVGKYVYHMVKDRTAPLSYVGGATKFYGSALYRFRESDFREVEQESGVSPAWPISYADLEPYYEQAEDLYRVHGSPEGDPSEPPRAKPFPYPPLPHDPFVAKFVQRLERAGASIAAIPRGIDYRPGGPCVLCSTCDGFYCQLDAKMDAEIAAIRPALATGKLQLTTGTDCVRVLTDGEGGKVTGVLLRRGGVEQVVRSEVVAVCAGLPGSALLLRRSRNEAHPEGLGNASGSLGRYLAAHSVGYVFPFVSWGKVPDIHTKTFGINTFYDGAPDWPYPTGIIQIAGQMPFWGEASRLIQPIARFVGAHSLMCFYMTEAPPTREAGVVFEGDEIVGRVAPVHNAKTFAKLRSLALDTFHRAGYRTLARQRAPYIWHEVGTARFGADPGTSVTDPNCQVHGIEGLYVVDASVPPSAGAVNTGLTIIALALRAGDHIAGRPAAVSRAFESQPSPA